MHLSKEVKKELMTMHSVQHVCVCVYVCVRARASYIPSLVSEKYSKVCILCVRVCVCMHTRTTACTCDCVRIRSSIFLLAFKREGGKNKFIFIVFDGACLCAFVRASVC